MRPYDCVFFMGDKSCSKGHGIRCVECRGIHCTVYDPIEEEEDEDYDTWRHIKQGESYISI